MQSIASLFWGEVCLSLFIMDLTFYNSFVENSFVTFARLVNNVCSLT